MKHTFRVKLREILFALLICMIASGCTSNTNNSEKKIIVSILPLKFLVEQIVEDDFEVQALVPPGASPETYEPTPQQLIAAGDAEMIFTVGLIDFEHNLAKALDEQNSRKTIPLSAGITLLKGDCGHSHSHAGHAHGVDPHIWTSPYELQTMATNIYNHVALLYPDSARYTINYERIISQLAELDSEVAAKISASGVKNILIYHPALTYYAQRYGIEQIAIENDGKEPSASAIKNIVNRAKADGIDKVFYQSQFSRSTVEIIASDIGGKAIEFDPLAENVVDNIRDITDLITEK